MEIIGLLFIVAVIVGLFLFIRNKHANIVDVEPNQAEVSAHNWLIENGHEPTITKAGELKYPLSQEYLDKQNQ